MSGRPRACSAARLAGAPLVMSGRVTRLDTVLRVPLETAGFHPFALDGDHLYAWIEGGPYSGDRPHRTVPLSFRSAGQAAERVGDPAVAHAIRAAARSYRSHGLGRYAEAAAGAERAVEDDDQGYVAWSLAELVRHRPARAIRSVPPLRSSGSRSARALRARSGPSGSLHVHARS